MIHEEKLIPEIRDWKVSNGQQFDIEDWIAIEGNIKLAIGYSIVFWPTFLEHDECVFIKSHFSPENFNEWLNVEYVDNYGQIEAVINHLHIMDLFTGERHNEITNEQIIYLGNILREIYEVKLKAEFPTRNFVVTFNGNDENQDLIDYQLTFYQDDSSSRLTRQRQLT